LSDALPGRLTLGVVAFGFTNVDLAGATNLAVGVLNAFGPLGDPAGEAAQGEEDGEHELGEAHSLVDEAGVEVYVGVELTFDEVVVVEGLFFETLGDIEQFVVAADGFEDF